MTASPASSPRDANFLVNKTGDFITALEEARTLAGFKPEDGMDIRLNIHRSSPFQLLTSTLMQAKAGGATEAQIAQALGAVVGRQRAQTLISQLRQLGDPAGVRLWSPPMLER